MIYIWEVNTVAANITFLNPGGTTIGRLKNSWLWASSPAGILIDKIFNLIDVESKVVKARITLKNDNFELKPEMFANVKVKYQEPVKKPTIPSEALIFDKSRYFVMVYKSDNDIETREVSVYKDTGKLIYIDSGLKEGEKVMTKFQLLVYDALND